MALSTTTLNADVLAIVCEFLTEASDIISFALTCSSLRPVAYKQLLSSRTIKITGNSIHKFHSFLFSDPHSHTPHIRALKIDLDLDSWLSLPNNSDPPNDLSIVINILTSCLCLEDIKLSFGGDFYGHSKTQDIRISDAISAIPSLRSLSVYGSMKDTVTVLREVRAPLRNVRIRCRNLPGVYWYPAALENTLNLPRLAPTLEKLEVAYFVVDREAIQELCNVQTPSVFGMAQYPTVRWLSIDWLMREPRLDHLQHLFPALDGSLSLEQLDPCMISNSYDDIRASNQQAQRCAPSHVWKKLYRLRVSDAAMLYVLGLLCPIQLVILDYPSTHTHLHYARDALRENPVPRLKLSLTFSSQVRILDELLSPELSRKLTHLMVCFSYSNGDGPWPPEEAEVFAQLQWKDFLDEILFSLRHLQGLTHLRIVIHATVYHGGSWAAQHSEDFIDAIRGSAFDFDGTADALARALPSLQFLALTTSGYLTRHCPEPLNILDNIWAVYERWNVTRAWRVAARPGVGVTQADDSDLVLVELHDEVAETIMRKEELVLSRTDETSLHLRDD